MATFAEVLFLMQFLVLLGVVIYKLYNLQNKEIPIVTNIIFFIVAAVAFGLGFVTLLNDPENTLIIPLFYMEIGIFILSVLFFIIDLFRVIAAIVGENSPRAYNSMEASRAASNGNR